ncbi:unnamed protein product [Thelazia callipaeda]|uniref:1-alkyl-2-acetylglycerophosphocholine esterase n=1 Tax=Thelazia callipaeda TaxID=103827 RepID=A0A0N5D0K7_THECL|nr:unnamed protein product [Thelazia callipaeda]
MGISESKSLLRAHPILQRLGTGNYEVGCAEIMVNAGEHDDIGTLATIFYPTEDDITSDDISQHPLWIPRQDYIDGLADYRNTSPRWMNFIYKWFIGEKRISARWHSRVNESIQNFPVFIFSHGLSACRHFYSIYCSSLASHGYVVAAIEHRDCSACWTYTLKIDEKTGEKIEIPVKVRKLKAVDDEFQLRNGQLHKRVAECIKTLHVLEELNLGQCTSDQENDKKLLLGNDFEWSQFKGRLNMNKIYIGGHSFGGATALATAAFSTDFCGVVVLDGWMFPIEKELLTSVRQPVLFMNAEYFQWDENVKDMLRVIESSKHSILFTFNEASHHSFTDFPLLIPVTIGRWLGIQNLRDPIYYAEAIIESTVFFLNYCNDPNETAFDVQQYKDIITMGAKFTRKLPQKSA